MKLGVYGHGPQSRRYLDPKNWPDGVEVVQEERLIIDGTKVSGCIVANDPKYRENLVNIFASGMPALIEKPLALSVDVAEKLLHSSRLHRSMFMVAHTHLWSRDFLRLKRSTSATVEWRGPERADGSCPAMLDWGPHAWSMAIALGTERVSTGRGDKAKNLVISGNRVYSGPFEGDMRPTPMANMLATFASLIDGGYDWRAEPDFALEVHRRCFRPSG